MYLVSCNEHLIKMARGKAVPFELCQIIVKYHKNGDSLNEIGEKLLLSRYPVRNIINTFKKTNSLAAKDSSGRKQTVADDNL